MSDPSPPSSPPTAARQPTSSPASADGPTPFVSLAGPQTRLFGLEAVPVSPSQRRDEGALWQTSGTSGRSGDNSSSSVALQRSLESRLLRALAVDGSPEFVLTWKRWAMPSGPPICALRARARRTSDNGCSSWPSPNAGPQNDTDSRWQERRAAVKAKGINGNGFGLTLGMAATLASWPTPEARNDAAGRTYTYDGGDKSKPRPSTLGLLTAWGTPTSRDHKDSASDLTNTPINALRGRQAMSSPAPTEERGALNPAHSRWLMGYPPAWCDCAVTATPSSRRSRQPSSEP